MIISIPSLPPNSGVHIRRDHTAFRQCEKQHRGNSTLKAKLVRKKAKLRVYRRFRKRDLKEKRAARKAERLANKATRKNPKNRPSDGADDE